MRNNIKKLLILLSINLLAPTPVLSQITLDSIETKTTAIIFAEHSKLSTENSLLRTQISSLEELNKLYVESDSIQKSEIKFYNDKVISDQKEIQFLKTSRKNIVTGSCIGGIVLFILGLIL